MSATLSKAVLTISIDLELDVAVPPLAERCPLAAISERLLEMLAQHEMPATWSIADPSTSVASLRIASRRAGHEIALCGDANWVGREVGRSHFARELARRAAAGQAQGLSISTLVVEAASLGERCDLAIRLGITAVRHPAPAKSSGHVQPARLRYGLWSFPVSHVLPGASRLLPGGGGRAIRGLIDRAIEKRGLVHLVIDAPRLATRGYAAQRVVDAALGHAEWRRRQGVLDVATLGATAASLSSQYQSIPSRSILRPAA